MVVGGVTSAKEVCVKSKNPSAVIKNIAKVFGSLSISYMIGDFGLKSNQTKPSELAT